MVSKRKRAPPAQPPLQQTAPSLKEYIWNELLLVLRKHSYVSLTGKRPSDMAMGNFRCVTIAIGEIHVDNPSCRARIWSSLQSHIQMMASAAQPCPGDPVTDAEFRRVALTVAYAIANPREFYSFFMSFSIYLTWWEWAIAMHGRYESHILFMSFTYVYYIPIMIFLYFLYTLF